jgi:hypothetical protein
MMLLLSACAGPTTHELPAAYHPQAGDNRGIVIGSVSALPAPRNPPWYEWSRYDFRSLSDPDVRGFVTSAFTWNPFYMWGSMPLCADDGLKARCAHLYAMLLPAGEYEFHAVIPAMQSYSSSAGMEANRWDVLLADYRFVVRPGQATYVGEFASRICIGSPGHGNDVMAAVGRASDQAARDIPLLLRKYSQLADMTIHYEPIGASPWRWRWRERQGYQPPYGWPSECSLEPDAIAQYLEGADQ